MAGVRIITLAVLALGAAPAAAGDATVLIVRSGKQSVQATPGFHCMPNAEGTGGSCEGGFPPLQTTGVVRFRPGGTITLLLAEPSTYVRWRASRLADGKEKWLAQAEARMIGKSGKRWRVRIPKDLRGANVLGFDAQYTNAYCLWEVGARMLKPRRKPS